MSGGSFQVDRSLWDDPTFRKSAMSELEAFLWMTREAAWKPRTKDLGTVSIQIERGQLAHSTRFMAGAFMWSEAKVRRFLKKIQNRRIIETKTDAGITVITICKYDENQLGAPTSDAGVTQEPTRERRTSDANKNTLNTREYITPSSDDDQRDQLDLIPEEPKPKKRRSVFPENWSPDDDLVVWARARGFSEIEVRRMAEHCVNHHRAKGSTFLDHRAAFRTWVQNQERFRSERNGAVANGGGVSSRAQSILERRQHRAE